MEEEAMGKIVKIFVIGLMLMLGLFFNGAVCGKIESDSISLNANDNYTNITFEEATVTPAEEYWAVIVGYGDDIYAYQDAQDMYNVLTRASDNWEASHIRFLVNESATKRNIRDAIQWMANKASTEDTCLFFFSGHGDNDTIDYNGDEADGIDESLTVFDAEIIDDELEKWIGEVKAKKVVAILEACFSGGVLTPYQISEAIETSSEFDGFAMDLEKTGCMVLTSSRMNETGLWVQALKNSVFTYYIVQGLWGAADLNGDRGISVRELSDYSFPKIVEFTENFDPNPQHPLLWPEDDIASNLTLIKLKTYYPKKIKVPEEYRTIQGAVEAAMPGDTIEVYPGTYNENLVINKPLTINAPHRYSKLHAANTTPCIFITIDNTSISGLTFQNGRHGIYLCGSNNNWITSNEVSNNEYQGVILWSSSENIIANNTAKNNGHNGIYLEGSGNNRITDNYASNNGYNGMSLNSSNNNEIQNNIANSNYYEGIGLWTSSENIIANSTIKNNGENGIYLNSSNNNIVTDNNASNNNLSGIYLEYSSNNTLRNNLMMGNLWNFGTDGDSYSDFNNDIDTSNLADGKPIYYLVGASGNVIDSSSNAGTVYCISCDNITVKDLNLINNFVGIGFYNTSNSRIQNNYLINELGGVFLYGSSSNAITGNTISDNIGGILLLDYSDSNTITDNEVTDNEHGILLLNSTSNTLRNNLLYYNRYNFGVEGDSYSDFVNDIDTSNTVDGKPIYYWIGRQDEQIPDDAGVVGVVNSINITAKDLTLTNNLQGILFAYTLNSKIENVTASNNWDGIRLMSSSNNTLTNNNASGNEGDGFWLWDSSNYNMLTSNTASNNTHSGIRIEQSNNNTIYINNFINNTENVYSENSSNIWNSPEKITYTYKDSTYTNYLGNYWDDYTSTDANNDGIWDYPYTIDLDKDYQPLVMPWENYVKPAEEEEIFDTGSPANPYPSIMGRHEGKIIPAYDITVSRLYTYPCAGTGGHTESIKIYENDELIASGTWNGYAADWHNITITPSVTLYKNNEYAYIIETGSYPQIIHEKSKEVTGGTITCTMFTDANAHTYDNWIPAIRLS